MGHDVTDRSTCCTIPTRPWFALRDYDCGVAVFADLRDLIVVFDAKTLPRYHLFQHGVSPLSLFPSSGNLDQ